MKNLLFCTLVIFISALVINPVFAQSDEAKIDIYSNKTIYNPWNEVVISVKVDNKSSEDVKMFAAVLYQGAFYFYSTWDLNPFAESHATQVSAGTVWDNPILRIPFFIKAKGTFTFYAAITDMDKVNILGIDSVTITIN